MAKTARKPKVYWAEIDGLNDWLVAAPNRSEALAALGVHQDLFAQGAAGEETEPAKVAAARARPGTVLRRPKGSTAAFAAPTASADWSAAAPRGPKRFPKTPDRKALRAAEARLQQIEDQHRQALADLEQDRARLDQRAAGEARRYEAARSEAETALDKAGGGKAIVQRRPKRTQKPRYSST